MSKVIFIGGGSFAKEIKSIAEENLFTIVGYVDETKKDINLDYLGKVEDLLSIKLDFDYVFLAFGGVNQQTMLKRKKMIDFIADNNLSTCSIISKNAIIEKDTKIGIGVFIAHAVVISYASEISDYCSLNTASVIGHDVFLEKNVVMAPKSYVSGNVKIKNSVLLGPGCNVLQGITINQNCIIGMGTDIFKNIPANSIVLPNLSKILKNT